MHNAALVLLGVIFYASAFAEPPPPLVETDLMVEGAQPWVNIDIGDQRGVHGIVDTGATMGVLPRSLTRGGVCVGSTRITSAIDLPIMCIPRIQLGAVKLSGVNILRNSQPYSHTGWAMFSEHRLLLDLAHADTAPLP